MKYLKWISLAALIAMLFNMAPAMLAENNIEVTGDAELSETEAPDLILRWQRKKPLPNCWWTGPLSSNFRMI